MYIKKIFSVLLILIILIAIFSPKAYATTADDIISAGDDFLGKGSDESTVIDEGKLKTTSTTVYKVLLTIAICTSVIIGAVLGIQFIFRKCRRKSKNFGSFSSIYYRMYSCLWSIYDMGNCG